MSNDPGSVAFIDQLNAEYAEAERLVPVGQNRRLASTAHVRAILDRILASADDLDSTTGPVPIIECCRTSFQQRASAHTRQAGSPVGTTVPLTVCNMCFETKNSTVAFWVNCGTVIAQVDLCNSCAKYAIDSLGAVPQIGLPPDDVEW